MSFAASLSKRVSSKRQERRERELEGEKWLKTEAKFVDVAVELFKERCIKAAKTAQCQTLVSFDVLTREVPKFPTYIVKDDQYLVDVWGQGDAASWYYARKGPNEPFAHGTPVHFAEMLEGMLPKFLEKVKDLGFTHCGRESGTWKIKAEWKNPDSSTDAEYTNGSTNGHAATNGRGRKAAAPTSPSPTRSASSSPKKRRTASPAKAAASASPSRTEVPSSDDER